MPGIILVLAGQARQAKGLGAVILVRAGVARCALDGAHMVGDVTLGARGAHGRIRFVVRLMMTFRALGALTRPGQPILAGEGAAGDCGDGPTCDAVEHALFIGRAVHPYGPDKGRLIKIFRVVKHCIQRKRRRG